MLLHGYFELQSNLTATSVADVPWTSWYVTSLTLTPETCSIHEYLRISLVIIIYVYSTASSIMINYNLFKIIISCAWYLTGAALVVGAVILIDDDGILDVGHDGVLE